MFQFEEIKKSYTQVKKRGARIIIGGIIFMAAEISSSVSTPTASYCFDPTPPVAAIFAKDDASRGMMAEPLFSSAMRDTEKSLLSEWIDALDELQEYEDDWDGEGSLAVRKDTIDSVKDLLKYTSGVIHYFYDVYPTPLGSLILEWKQGQMTVIAEVIREKFAIYRDRFSDGSDVTDYVLSDAITPQLISSIYSFFA